MIEPIIVLAVMHQTFFDDPHQRELYYMKPLEVVEMTLEEAEDIQQELDRYGDTERYLEFKPKELWVKDEWEKWVADRCPECGRPSSEERICFECRNARGF